LRHPRSLARRQRQDEQFVTKVTENPHVERSIEHDGRDRKTLYADDRLAVVKDNPVGAKMMAGHDLMALSVALNIMTKCSTSVQPADFR